jgi:hypothetical protein
MSIEFYAKLLIVIGLKISSVVNERAKIESNGGIGISKEDYMNILSNKKKEYDILYRQHIIIQEKIRSVCTELIIPFNHIISSINREINKQILDGLSRNFKINESDKKNIDDICKLI